MNRIKLFGKIESVSDLKFNVYPKLKVYMEIEIRVICGYVFKCVDYERACDSLR